MNKGNIPVNLTKESFTFEASHRLVKYKGPCENWHGHSYEMSVTVQGVPNPQTGLVIDFKDLKSIVNDTIIQYVDHSNLNNVMSRQFSMRGNTTCENMIIAFWWALDHEICERFEGVVLQEMRLYETKNSCAFLSREMVYSE